ncbi:CRISPR-associated protein Csb1 [Lipingzhangella halophila]|uniref:CRISPR-associated protein Csb1 n=1 Tax=Lipingzhangella halophila TaxID=1783352 RepID=A0A7W7RG65_9ACTN|nr:type I-U CRISPR-associated RAMP protein Csb1/Cas7u [Lipingzhangella halophila]MBB4931375.1 CRISPR-associated protein Csb1 [Lipingzhangella halophila]
MAHLNELATALLDEVGPNRSAAGVVMSSRWRAPDDGKVYPPTFPVDGPSRYLYEKRHVPGESEPREVVVLDQPASQANRVEAALLEARDEGRIRLPLFVLRASTTDGERRLTSLEFPHRFADAYLRDSELDGVLFAKTTPGARLRETTSNDVRPLFERSPESLVFGSWDSHRKGRSVKFPRVFSSSMIGWDPQIGQRAGGKMDPFNLTGAVKDSAVTEGDWEFSATGEAKKKGAKLSELGHSNIAPSLDHGGVSITRADRSGWLSLSGLQRLRFGDAPRETAWLARATLAAMAVAGDRLAFDHPSVWLRSGCDLVRTTDTIGFERATGEVNPLQVSADEAIAAFHALRDRTAEAGIVMAQDTIELTPTAGLANAIEYATTRAQADEAGEE